MTCRNTATTSGKSGMARSLPVLILQPSMVLLRTYIQPSARSKSFNEQMNQFTDP